MLNTIPVHEEIIEICLVPTAVAPGGACGTSPVSGAFLVLCRVANLKGGRSTWIECFSSGPECSFAPRKTEIRNLSLIMDSLPAEVLFALVHFS